MPAGAGARSSAAVIVCGHDLAVDVRLAHPPGDQLGVLGAEVDDQDGVEVGGHAVHRSVTHAHALGPLQRLPSVCSAGATMTSAFWNSLTVS